MTAEQVIEAFQPFVEEPFANCPDFEQGRDCLRAAAHAFLQDNMEQVKQHCLEGVSGRTIVLALTEMFDLLHRQLYKAVCRDLDPQQCKATALIALGGYGRSEMSPRSDIDLMFCYADEGKEAARIISDRMLYLLWDLKLDVGYSIRSVQECIEESSDSTVRTSLLDGRLIVGSEELFNNFEKQVVTHAMSYQTQNFIQAKLDEAELRIKKYGSSVYLLEPNVKEGEGGLRDLQNALWIARAKFKTADVNGLLHKGVINEKDANDYHDAQDYLWKIRNFIHFSAQRKSDQLSFELQEELAKFLGYRSNGKSSAVELFMRDYYSRANDVERLVRLLVRLSTRENEAHAGRLLRYLTRRSIDPDFSIIRGELRIRDKEVLLNDPTQMMYAFELSQRHNVVFDLDLKNLILDNLDLIDDKIRRSRAINQSFMNILRHGKNVGKTLRRMHHMMFLNAFIPEFKNIYCKVQFDLYHIYTVDIHSIFAIEYIEELWSGELEEEQPLLTEVSRNLEKPELLILATLFHDIGKGSGKDHSVRGAEMVPRIARRMRLGREDSERLRFLVLHHLEMAHISQRRDLQDMNMIAQFAELMGMSENLRMLYLLTYADIKAVGPDVWTEWKGNLLKELYEKTWDIIEKRDFYLEKNSEKVRNRRRHIRDALIEEFSESKVTKAINSLNTRYLMTYRSREIIPHMRLSLQRGKDTLTMTVEHNEDAHYTELTVATLDSAGLFSCIAGVLAAYSINILGAQIHTRTDGTVLDILQVNSPVGGIVDKPRKWQRVEADLCAVIEGRLKVDELMARREEPEFVKKEEKRERRPDRVDFDNAVSDRYTVIDVFAHDRVGLLYEITDTFKDLGLYIAVSKISTKVDQVADIFYVNDIFGQKITDPDRIDIIRKTLLERLA